MRNRDVFFLLFFLPLFFFKLLMFDTSGNVLKVVAVFCFAIFLLQMINENDFKRKELLFWIVAGAFLSLLMLHCGKEGALFSLIAIVSMRKTNLIRNQSILFYFGIIGVLLCLYFTKETHEAIRYVGGTWVSVTKRSNIAFVSFFAVLNLYLMTFKKTKYKTIIVLSLLSYGVYRYTGCRTGILCAGLLIILLLLYKMQWFQKSRIVKIIICAMPSLCLVASVITVYLYSEGTRVGLWLNALLQGRLRQGSLFFQTYTPKLFGQKLAENFSSSSFFVLDSAYLDMILCYGIIFTILWIYLNTKTILWLYSKQNYIGVSIMVAYSAFGIAETFLPNCFLNPSLLLCGSFVLEKIGSRINESKPIRLRFVRKKQVAE